MNAKLHIQLNRHTTTTRRPRRVVSLSLILLFLVFVVLYYFVNLWFTRNTVFAAAPENTQFAVQLLINKKTMPILEPIFSSIPLISNRSLSLKDVQKFTQGEIGWFFHEDGTRSVAIRAKKSDLPMKLLDSNQIAVQQIKPKVFLLSEKLQPVKGIRSRRSFGSLLPTIGRRLGQFNEKGQKTSAIVARKDKITLNLNNKIEKVNTFNTQKVQEGTTIVMSLPIFEERIGSMFQTLFPDKEMLDSILSKNGLVMIDKNNEFLVVSDVNLDEKQRVIFLQTMLALKNPQIIKKQLVDNTETQEFVSDPSLVSVEEKTIEGNVFLKASINEAKSYYLSKSSVFLLSNSEEKLRNWANNDQNAKMLKLCDANVAFVSLKDFFESNSFTTDHYTNDTTRLLLTNFSSMSIQKGWNSANLNLCY